MTSLWVRSITFLLKLEQNNAESAHVANKTTQQFAAGGKDQSQFYR